MTPEEAYDKCKKENRRIQKLEDLIATDPGYSYYYANDIIKGPWKRGKEAISKDPHCSYEYTRNLIKGPFELGEEVISKNSEYSYYYARDIIQEPFEKCHPIIFNSEYKNNYMIFLKSKKYELNKISEWLI